jgi:hypothetical protein
MTSFLSSKLKAFRRLFDLDKDKKPIALPGRMSARQQERTKRQLMILGIPAHYRPKCTHADRNAVFNKAVDSSGHEYSLMGNGMVLRTKARMKKKERLKWRRRSEQYDHATA